MTPSVTEPIPEKTGSHPTAKLSGLPWLSGLLLLGCGAITLGPLTPTWNTNANYSFGWWIPVVSMVLFAERWPMRPARQVPVSQSLVWLLAIWGLLFLTFRLVAETDPDWRPGLWIMVGLYVGALLRWLWLEGGMAWTRYFAFPVGFLFLCLPWPFEIEYPLVQGLMRWNAALVAGSLRAIGIFAEPSGNIIQLQNCKLGVEEACSGILSLQASLVMGFLLGEIYRLSVQRRVGLVLISMMLALLGNYLRTLFLALMAFYSGPAAVPQWHDTAGYAILVFTAVGSWMASLLLAQGKATELAELTRGSRPDSIAPTSGSALRFAATIFGLALLAEGLTQAWFGWRDSHLERHPTWTAQMPTTNGSYQPVTFSDVTLEALRCDKSAGGHWKDSRGWDWTAYWLQYEPKPYTRVVLGWHTPDHCLPSVGLIKDRDYPDFTAKLNGLDFYVHPKKFMAKDTPIYLFWLVYPNRGGLPSDSYDLPGTPITSKIHSHMVDLWNGYRGVGVETLEVAIIGPDSFEEAKTQYLAALQAMAQPETSH